MLKHNEQLMDSSENAVDNVAADGCSSTKDGGIAHLFTKLLSLFLEFAVFPAVGACSRGGQLKGHVAVV